MIVVVNIRKSLKAGVPIIIATAQAWALSFDKCSTCDYVIAVDTGTIVGYFNLNGVHHVGSKRVSFDLTPCTPAQIAIINGIIGTTSLRGIQRGKYIP